MKKILTYGLTVFMTLSLGAPAESVASDRETPTVKVVREWGPNVVNIGTEKVALLRQHPFWGRYGNQMDAGFQQFFGPQQVSTVKVQSIGSGVILNKEGLLVTNAHVVNRASKIYVNFSNGKRAEGTALAIDLGNDLALVKVTPPDPVKDLKLAGTADVLVGETAVAIGNPLGLENSVSVGVISGKNRNFQLPQGKIVMTGLLQTDAAINIGNSGGALFNLDGELIGVNLAVVQQASNIGFAVPSDKIKTLLELYRTQKLKEKDQAPKGARIQV